MYAMKMLGLAVLAGICVVGFVVGYNYFQGLSARQKARSEASRLNNEINFVISSSDNNKNLNIEIPDDYVLQFEENRIVIDGMKFPKDNPYELPVDGPELGPGVHNLLIKIERNNSDEWIVRVREVD